MCSLWITGPPGKFLLRSNASLAGQCGRPSYKDVPFVRDTPSGGRARPPARGAEPWREPPPRAALALAGELPPDFLQLDETTICVHGVTERRGLSPERRLRPGAATLRPER